MNEKERDFELEEILREFGSGSIEDLTAGEEEISHGIDDLADLLASLQGEPEETAEEQPEPEVPEQNEEEPEAEEPAPEPELFTMEELEVATAHTILTDDAQEELPEEEPEEPESTPVTSDTIRLDDLSEIAAAAAETSAEESVGDETIRLEPVLETEVDGDQEESEAPAEEPVEGAEQTPAGEEDMDVIPPEPIQFRPRQRLRDLKRDLIAGPEKRYYELSEQGVGKLQMAMFLGLIVVLLSAGAAVLYNGGLIPESRMRLMVFGQVLAMLIGALLGSHQMIDGVSDLFHGRFTLNTMLAVTFVACIVDSIFCLNELRVPICAAFTLEVIMSLWSTYHQRTTEMGMMDTMRKAVRLDSVVKCEDYHNGRPGFLRGEGQVADFMDHFDEVSGPEKRLNIYALISLILSLGIAVFAGLRHGISMGFQIFSTSLLVAVPASTFVTLSRPLSVLERRLHSLGTVLCGWSGIKGLGGKAAVTLNDEDLFPAGSAKLNGVKFYSDRNTEQVIAYSAALMRVNGGTLAPIFDQLLTSRAGIRYSATNVQYYGNGGISGEINGEKILMGTLDFLQEMGVAIPEGVMVKQAVYAAIGGELAGLFAVSYNRMKYSALGVNTLCSCCGLNNVIVARDFMVTGPFMKEKFGVRPRRLVFPTREERMELMAKQPAEDAAALALTTQEGLAPMAYAITGARALRKAWNLGSAIHMIGGILGMVVMLALAVLGSVHLLTPLHVLMYQLVWMIPGLLVSIWPRTA